MQQLTESAYAVNKEQVSEVPAGMRIHDLKDREVINICDCKRLGYVCDVDFDPITGCVCYLIVPGPCQFCGFLGRDSEYIIPFHCVKQIGKEIILVEIRPEDCLCKCL